ncbi:hypothetical protein FRB94_009021 [Tulasnella sp. JGI-2019a]|nr:hypothetical protein FRB94_009021 [Tulasnella sp. JGI-2019a]
MSESPDPYRRRPITPVYNGPSTYQHHSLPQSSFKLPPIRTLGLAHEPSGSPAPSNPNAMDMPPPQTLPRESWSRSSAGAVMRSMSSDGGHSHTQPPDSPFAASTFSQSSRRSALYESTNASTQQQQPPSQQYGGMEPPAMNGAHPHGGQQQSPSDGYSLGQKRPRGNSPPPSLPPPPQPPQASPSSAQSSSYRGEPSQYPQQQQPPPDPRGGYPQPTQPHLLETRPVGSYPPTHTPALPPPPPGQSQIYHSGASLGQQQQPPYPPTYAGQPQQQQQQHAPPTSAPQAMPPPASDMSMSNGTMYGQRPPLPPPIQGMPPPPPGAYGFSHSQAPPMGYSSWQQAPPGPPLQPPPQSYNGYHVQPPPQQYPPQQPPAQQGAYGAPPPVQVGQYAQYPPQPQPQPQQQQQSPPLSAPPALEWSNGPPQGAPMMMATTSSQPIGMGPPPGGPQLPPQPQPSMQPPVSSSVITTAPSDKPIAQILEHCQRIMAFANYYAGFQPHAPGAPPRPTRPSLQETKEMAQRAETIVQLLFRLADESKPIRKALDASAAGNSNHHPNGSASGSVTGPSVGRSATPAMNNAIVSDRDAANGKKKRKIGDRHDLDSTDAAGAHGDENANPNGAANGDGEWGMSKDQRLRMFGNNQEAYELAEKDMRTITAKRTASQGGVLPQQKTKYKKRSRATPPGKCHSCFSTETPEWRRGPDGARTLCNACGLHFAKLAKRSPQTYITIPMLQASAHKNGIGANGIVPAQPGAVNGTVGGVRAANVNITRRGTEGGEDGQDEDEDDEDEEGGEDEEGANNGNAGRKTEVVESLAETVSVPEARHQMRAAAANGKGKAKGSGRKELDGGDSLPPLPPPSHAPVPAVVVNASAPANREGDDDDEDQDDEDEDEDYENDAGRRRPVKRQKQQPAPSSSQNKYPPLQSRPVGGSSWGSAPSNANGFGGRLDGPSPSAPLPPLDSGSSQKSYGLNPADAPYENGAHASWKSSNKSTQRRSNSGGNHKNGKGKTASNNQHERLSTLAPPGWGGVPIPTTHQSHSSKSSSRPGVSPPPYARGGGDGEGYGHGDDDSDGNGDDGDGDDDGDGGGDAFRRLKGSSNLRTASAGRV